MDLDTFRFETVEMAEVTRLHWRSVRLALLLSYAIEHGATSRMSMTSNENNLVEQASEDRFVRQFINALPDGPMAFHFPSKPYVADLVLERAVEP